VPRGDSGICPFTEVLSMWTRRGQNGLKRIRQTNKMEYHRHEKLSDINSFGYKSAQNLQQSPALL
jgi:hypothetical protein